MFDFNGRIPGAVNRGAESTNRTQISTVDRALLAGLETVKRDMDPYEGICKGGVERATRNLRKNLCEGGDEGLAGRKEIIEHPHG